MNPRQLSAVCAMAAWLMVQPALAQNQGQGQGTQPSPPPAPPPQFNATVTVVGVTPLPGLGVPLNRVPGNVQVASSVELARTPGVHVGAQLGDALASVHLNEAQSSTFQPDVQFRGFASSPLLGLPQGLAVYQDGVRVNEPFGDTVNWDALPANALAGVVLMPGSNPLFGLNALGGALSLQTKTGFSHPGHAARFSTGSFGRRWAELESGGRVGSSVAYFAAARWLQEDGWRDHSPSRVTQLFGSVAWQSDRARLAATVTGSANRLIGNGPAPVQLLLEDRRQVFTHPDETATDIGLFTLTGRRQWSPGVELEGVAYFRPATVGTFNGDDTPYAECAAQRFRELLCHDDGDGLPVLDRSGAPLAYDDARPLDATNNASTTRSRGWGGTAQATVTRQLAGRDNHFVAGASVDGARSHYSSETELAYLTDTRGTLGGGLFDRDADVRLRTSVAHVAAFAGDYLTVLPRLTISGSARLTHSAMRLRDRLGDDLNGDHTFTAFNAAGGATFEFRPVLSLFGGLSRSTRVPTPSELSCADPDDPCRLPNAFLSDPPLQMVVAHTWEGGARGRWRGASWAAAAFNTRSRDDIIFVSSGPLTNHGHFENVGTTNRAGLELTGAGGTGPAGIQWRASYTYLRATFVSPLVLGSANHPDAVDGEIAVEAGDSIPNVPRHVAKADLLVPVGHLDLAASVSRMSPQYLRGDEANQLLPIDPATTVNLMAGYRLGRGVTITARVTNVFDTRPASFGVLGEADDVLGDGYDDPRFLSPSAPRAAWIGIELRPR